MASDTIETTIDPIDALIGGRVRAFREAQKITQAGLAGAIGVTFQQVQKYERGVNRISAARLLQIANFLRLPIADFYPNETMPEGAATPQFQAIGRAYVQMTPHQQASLLSIAEAIAGKPTGPHAERMAA
ncbi:helix-turn-helix domain-containing protein [Brevundimonas sp.]|uniref:helix-turn-helix domain-containing protein n=1 Tax=Brevundimonas sp. TaxID=1871086 RepID=UPI00257C0BFE|nr:helix-turn-helix domain-containing protein [Brevundimonas sp.]